jgi:hypothetical protein
MRRFRTAALLAGGVVAAAVVVPGVAPVAGASTHETVTHGMQMRNAHAAGRPTKGTKNLTYHGGAVGLTPRVVIVYWGSQWGSEGSPNDLAGEIPLQYNFFHAITSNAWVNSVKQYCIGTGPTSVGATSGATSCSNPIPSFPTNLVAAQFWDTASPAPSKPTQSQLAAEALRAANQYGSLTDVQFVIDTASGNNASGFGTQYCAWHSSTTGTVAGKSKTIAYTNMPYVADAGASCGAGFVNDSSVDSATQGVTIVGGHEWAETVSDEYPNGGWLDGSGAENGDKCAWISSGQGASTVVTTTGNNHFAVQSLWSNAASGCVNS